MSPKEPKTYPKVWMFVVVFVIAVLVAAFLLADGASNSPPPWVLDISPIESLDEEQIRRVDEIWQQFEHHDHVHSFHASAPLFNGSLYRFYSFWWHDGDAAYADRPLHIRAEIFRDKETAAYFMQEQSGIAEDILIGNVRIRLSEASGALQRHNILYANQFIALLVEILQEETT